MQVSNLQPLQYCIGHCCLIVFFSKMSDTRKQCMCDVNMWSYLYNHESINHCFLSIESLQLHLYFHNQWLQSADAASYGIKVIHQSVWTGDILATQVSSLDYAINTVYSVNLSNTVICLWIYFYNVLCASSGVPAWLFVCRWALGVVLLGHRLPVKLWRMFWFLFEQIWVR